MTVDNEDTPTTGRWRPAIDALTTSFGTHVGQPATVVNASEFEDGFSCLLRGPAPQDPTLQIAWQAVLGMQEIDGKPDVSVSLFLYSRGRRLRLDNQPGSYQEITYDGPLDGTGTWHDEGWLQDDFGEFAAHDHYGD